jgi:flagellar basal-body rod protein FlgB
MAAIPTMQLIEGYLKVTNDRQQMVVGNMANIDTPGYHTKDIDFRSAMQQVVNNDGGPLIETASHELEGLPSRPDGNNVNIDRESMMLSETQLQYQMGVQLIKAEFHKLLTAIKEGS